MPSKRTRRIACVVSSIFIVAASSALAGCQPASWGESASHPLPAGVDKGTRQPAATWVPSIKDVIEDIVVGTQWDASSVSAFDKDAPCYTPAAGEDETDPVGSKVSAATADEAKSAFEGAEKDVVLIAEDECGWKVGYAPEVPEGKPPAIVHSSSDEGDTAYIWKESVHSPEANWFATGDTDSLRTALEVASGRRLYGDIVADYYRDNGHYAVYAYYRADKAEDNSFSLVKTVVAVDLDTGAATELIVSVISEKPAALNSSR